MCKTFLANFAADDNGGNATGISDTNKNYHTYEIDWNPDSITWSIDDKPVRTKNRADTWNATANRFDFPQTPSRVQLSLWPAGKPGNGEGTIAWSGGEIQWNSPYMKNGYYFAAFASVDIQCYDPPQGANKQGDSSYIFTDAAMTNSTVEISDKETVLKSLEGTGVDMDKGSDTSTSSGAAKTSAAAQVPGLSGVGADGQRGGNAASSAGGGGGTGTAGSGPSQTGFSQGGDSNGSGSGSGAAPHVEKGLQTSFFAVVVGMFALMVL